tara:strand:- start:362 stop:712 length:351 start_codon:yes stop_codon:yes gene_type:complete
MSKISLNQAVNRKLINQIHLVEKWEATDKLVTLTLNGYRNLDEVRKVIFNSSVLKVEAWETVMLSDVYKLHIAWNDLAKRLYSEQLTDNDRAVDGMTDDDLKAMYEDWKSRNGGSK